jgi:hypothetical protein
LAAAPPATGWKTGVSTSPRLPVDDQVEVALAVDLLGVGQAVPLLGKRPERLGEERRRGHPDGDLAGLRPEERALRADDVAQVELLEGGVGVVADHVLLHVELELALLVEDLDELALAHVPDGHEPAGHGHRDRVVLAFLVGLERLAREMAGLKLGPERIHPRGPQLGELLPAHGVLVVGDVGGDFAHVSGSSCRRAARWANGNFCGIDA